MPINFDSGKHDTIIKENENRKNNWSESKRPKMIINEVDPIYTFDDIVLDENVKKQILYIVSMEVNKDLIYETYPTNA